MTIRESIVEVDAPVTTLEGVLSDQAALAGVLNTLYELHLTILSVMRQEIELNVISQHDLVLTQFKERQE